MGLEEDDKEDEDDNEEDEEGRGEDELGWKGEEGEEGEEANEIACPTNESGVTNIWGEFDSTTLSVDRCLLTFPGKGKGARIGALKCLFFRFKQGTSFSNMLFSMDSRKLGPTFLNRAGRESEYFGGLPNNKP